MHRGLWLLLSGGQDPLLGEAEAGAWAEPSPLGTGRVEVSFLSGIVSQDSKSLSS